MSRHPEATPIPPMPNDRRDQAEQRERPERPEQPERPEKPERPEPPERPEQPERPEVVAAPAGPVIVLPGGQTISLPGGASPRALHQAAGAKREAILDLIRSARARREEIAGQLRNPDVGGADRAGLERRVTEWDARIIELEKQLVEADQQFVATAAVPGAVAQDRRSGPPEEVIFLVVSLVFTLAVLMPIAVAHARRVWKRTGTAVAQAPAWMQERFVRLEQAVDAIAIEVESIGEGQRFMTKLLSEGELRAIPQSSGQPVELSASERGSQG